MLIEYPAIREETFFSWLYRQSIFYESGNYPLFLLTTEYWACRHQGAFDRDFDFSSEFFYISCDYLSIIPKDCQAIFSAKSTWVIPEYYRRAFCGDCFCEQIKKYKYPASLTTWAGVGSPYCFEHNKLLLNFPLGNKISLNPALVGFEFYSRRRLHFEGKGVHAFLSQARLVGLAARVVHHLDFMESSVSLDKIRGSRRWQACRRIIQIILYPSYGVINTIWSKKRVVPRVNNLYQALEFGALCADSEDRAIALLLLGMVLDLFSSDELSLIINQLSSFEFFDVRFYDALSFGRCCNVFVGLHFKAMIDSVARFSADFDSPAVSQFVIGFCRASE
jgi:hypothetical protein